VLQNRSESVREYLVKDNCRTQLSRLCAAWEIEDGLLLARIDMDQDQQSPYASTPAIASSVLECEYVADGPTWPVV
jgi:hypothetical protein